MTRCFNPYNSKHVIIIHYQSFITVKHKPDNYSYNYVYYACT